MECSICHSEIVDKVYMTCMARHPYCFKCLLLSVETTNELKNCPLCRGGDKFIILENSDTPENNDFYSIYQFKKSIPILHKILSENVSSNSCLIPEYLLLNYVKNKKQIMLVNFLIEHDQKIDDIIPLIKWNDKKSIEELSSDILNNIVNVATNDIFGSSNSNGIPSFFAGPFSFTTSSNRR